MTRITAARLERIARDAGRKLMVQEDEIWSRHSGDKVGCAAGLGGVIRTLSHAVMMARRSDDPHTTTWLYQHFAGRFFGVRNDQDLAAFARTLRRGRPLVQVQDHLALYRGRAPRGLV